MDARERAGSATAFRRVGPGWMGRSGLRRWPWRAATATMGRSGAPKDWSPAFRIQIRSMWPVALSCRPRNWRPTPGPPLPDPPLRSSTGSFDAARPLPRPFRPRPGADPRRGQLAGARVQVGGRRAVLRPARRWGVSVRRGRQPLHRLRGLVGADDRRPQPSARARSGGQGNRRRAVLRRALPGRGHHGRNHHRPGAVLPDGAHGQLRHRGHPLGDPPGARGHRAPAHRQVRRLLPRPRRFVPGQGRQRHADPGRADLAGRARGPERADRHPELQRLRRRHGTVR